MEYVGKLIAIVKSGRPNQGDEDILNTISHLRVRLDRNLTGDGLFQSIIASTNTALSELPYLRTSHEFCNARIAALVDDTSYSNAPPSQREQQATASAEQIRSLKSQVTQLESSLHASNVECKLRT